MTFSDFQTMYAHAYTIGFFFGIATALLVAFLGKRG